MLAIAKQRCAPMKCVSFEQADVTQLPFKDAQFDIALASQVYEYVEQIDEALRELARVVRPGGRVALVDTDWESAVWQATMMRVCAAC
jgi:ubiquinone/menaquinone biosynthesis C-methylase UbiE